MTKGIGSHTQPIRGITDSWITPLYLIHELGPFDLDPCQCTSQPWPCANYHFTIDDDGLRQQWFGRVWLNPPYGRETGKWLAKLADHGRGTALIFARTETSMFFQYVWERASGLFFLKGRLRFYKPNGTIGSSNSGGPSVLVAYGDSDAEILRNCRLPGRFVSLV